MKHLIAPSLLSANFANLEGDINMLNKSEADWAELLKTSSTWRSLAVAQSGTSFGYACKIAIIPIIANEYLGGAISPGIRMRFRSLNYFTANLPLLVKEEPIDYIGTDTKESINSGVVNGVLQEIDGVINHYKNKYSHLTVVLTGGDTNFLSKQLKSSIFAHQNFLLKGLNDILIFNLNK